MFEQLLKSENRDILSNLIKYFNEEHYDILLVSSDIFYINLTENKMLYDDYVSKKFGKPKDIHSSNIDKKMEMEMEMGIKTYVIDFLISNSIIKMRLAYKNWLGCNNVPISIILKISSDVYIIGKTSKKIYNAKKFYAHSFEEAILLIDASYYFEDTSFIYYLLSYTIGIKKFTSIKDIKNSINETTRRRSMKQDHSDFYYPIKLL